MYSINLSEIKIDEFEKILEKAQLLPTEKVILNNLSLNMQKFKLKGYSNLLEIQKLLKNKKKYETISNYIDVDKEFLIKLNRMINSFVVKTVSLEKLEIFTNEELNLLVEQKIKNTEHFYNYMINMEQMKSLSNKLLISFEKLEYALHISDILRINGVGVSFAKLLYHLGIKSINDYNNTSSITILNLVKEYNKINNHSKATLGISDIDYCRRFCEKLDCDLI